MVCVLTTYITDYNLILEGPCSYTPILESYQMQTSIQYTLSCDVNSIGSNYNMVISDDGMDGYDKWLLGALFTT